MRSSQSRMDPVTIGAWVTALIAVGGVIAGTVKFLFWVFDEYQKRKSHKGFSAPKETLRLATTPLGSCWWSMGKTGDEPAMQIVGAMFATNIASVPIRIPQVELRYGFLGRKRAAGIVMVSAAAQRNLYGMYDIPPAKPGTPAFTSGCTPPSRKRRSRSSPDHWSSSTSSGTGTG